MSGILRLKGASSGYVELSAPDSGANTTINTGLLVYKDSANGTIIGTDLHDSVAVQGQFDSAFPSAFDTRLTSTTTISGIKTFSDSAVFSGVAQANNFIIPNGYAYRAYQNDGTFDNVIYYSNLNEVFFGRDNREINFRTNATIQATIDSNGNVGIGVTNPTRVLQTDGSQVDFSRSGKKIELNPNSGNANTHSTIQVDNGMGLSFDQSSFGEMMRIDSSGNVGIGTNNPSCLLDLYKSTNTTGSSTGTTLLNLRNYVGNDLNQQKTFVDFTLTDGNANETPQVRIGAELGQNGNADDQFKEGSGAFVVYTNNADTTSGDAGASLAERMRVDYAGNVGIGTTSPNVKLDVQGSPSAPATSGTAQAGSLRLSQTQGNGVLDMGFYTSANGTAWLQSTNKTNLATNYDLALQPNGGKVGIGTASPSGMLHLKSTGKVEVILEADTDNATETDNARIIFKQDGALVVGRVGYANNLNDLEVWNEYNGAIYFGTNNNTRMTIAGGGAVTIAGSLSKGSGSFKIDHPLESKTDTHHLVHSFIEGPQADLIYRGKVDLIDGTASVNIDTIAGMTEGTFVALNREVQCFTSNESDWDAVKGSVSGNILTIECQNTSSTATVSWLVIGERQDPHMYETEWTDEDGKVIVEPLKETAAIEEG